MRIDDSEFHKIMSSLLGQRQIVIVANCISRHGARYKDEFSSAERRYVTKSGYRNVVERVKRPIFAHGIKTRTFFEIIRTQHKPAEITALYFNQAGNWSQAKIVRVGREQDKT